MKITSVPNVSDDADNLAICSDVGYHDDDVELACDECGCKIYARPETTVLRRKMCWNCFMKKLKSGEIPRDTLEACFTDNTRQEVSKALGREVTVGELVDIILKEFKEGQ